MYHIWIEGLARAAGVESKPRHVEAPLSTRPGLLESLAYWVKVMGGVVVGHRRTGKTEPESLRRPV